MVFNSNTTADTKIAVLEERLSSYEIMMKKIDEAIQVMSKTSQNISKMLAVHEEKIEQCNKVDELISKSIDELRKENKEQHKEVEERIDGLESKIDGFTKFRWMLLGGVIILSFLISNSHVIIDVLTTTEEPARVETVK